MSYFTTLKYCAKNFIDVNYYGYLRFFKKILQNSILA